MSQFEIFTVPICSGDERVDMALSRVQSVGASAVVMAHEGAFTAVPVEALQEAVHRAKTSTVNLIKGPVITPLQTAHIVNLKLDFAEPAADLVEAAFERLNADAFVLPVGSMPEGSPAVTIFGRLNSRAMEVVRPVYECTVGHETYSSPGTGMCKKHAAPLKRIR